MGHTICENTPQVESGLGTTVRQPLIVDSFSHDAASQQCQLLCPNRIFFLITKEGGTFLLPSTTFQHLPTPVLWELKTSSRPMGSRVLGICCQLISVKVPVTLLEYRSTTALAVLNIDTQRGKIIDGKLYLIYLKLD